MRFHDDGTPAALPQDPILLATRSRDKAREIRAILTNLASRIVTLDELGVTPVPAEDDIEAYDSFIENAHAKAAHFLRVTGMPTLADDSGICVDALDGAPGVRSRRFAQDADVDDPDAFDLDDANNRLLLRRLGSVPADRRGARYTCAAVLHLPDSHRSAAIGTCSGSILREPRGTNGFGYDPLFLDPASALSFAELDTSLKHRRSHRARAFRALAANAPRALDHHTQSR